MDVDVQSEVVPELAPRPRRRWRRAAIVAAAFAAGSVLSGGGAVWASHQFSDVPSSNQFHDDIAWMVNNGIANGYEDGTFRPTAPVSRQAFAAFLHRYNDSIEMRTQAVDLGTGSYFPVTIACPPGKQAIAGGAFGPVTLPSRKTVLVRSSPSLNEQDWQVAFETIDGSSVDPYSFTGWAWCAPR